jgi:hypothetical protein
MSNKAISFLRAKRQNEGVVLSWYKCTRFCDEKSASEFSEFSIYRKNCRDFEFNFDYEEYFCDIQMEDCELIFHGQVECSNNRKFTFIDKKVETGCTYAYFVRPKTTPALGPVPVKVRNYDVWWPYEKLIRRINTLCKKYPQINKEICGKTVCGRDIFALKIGTGKPFLGLVGAVHPGEAGPELIIGALEKLMESNPKELEYCSIVAIPSVNIDVREQLVEGVPWYLRTNQAGVDLNRNFPAEWDTVAKNYGLSTDDRDSMTYRGNFPASEPETQSIISFFKENTPECIFAFHALAGLCDIPALTAGGVDKSNESFYKLTKLYAHTYGSGLHPELTPDDTWLSFGGTEGGMTRWTWQKLGIPGFDLEMSDQIAPEALKACRVDKTSPELLNQYVEKHANAIKKILSLKTN